MKKTYLLLGLIAILLFSCVENKGNYNYTELSKIEITGIDEEYTRITFKESLDIPLNVISDNPDDKFDYMWTLYDANAKTNIKLDTISFEKELTFPITLKQGVYNGICRIKNSDTGYAIYKEFQLKVVTQFSLGFYLLKSNEDNSVDMDLHIPKTNETIENVINRATGNQLSGKPISLGLLFNYCHIDSETNDYRFAISLALITDKEVNIMRVEDMGLIYDHNSMFYGAAPQETPMYIYQGGFCIGYLSNLGHYASAQAPQWDMLGAGKFGYPGPIEGGLQPNKSVVFTDDVLFCFDEKNGRFMTADWNGGVKGFENENADGKLVPEAPLPNEIDDKLLFLGRSKISGEQFGYAIFEEKSNPSKKYIDIINLGAVAFETSNPIIEKKAVPVASKLNNATMYTSNELSVKCIYFVEGGKLYMYDVNGDTEELLTPQGMANDEEITYITNKYWTAKNDLENNFNHLMIATYKGGNYKVYMYDMLGGKTKGAPIKVLSGKGRVSKLQFVSPMMNGESAPYYPLSNS